MALAKSYKLVNYLTIGLLCLVITFACASAASVNRDGFNIYKDFLRAKSDELEFGDDFDQNQLIAYAYAYRMPFAFADADNAYGPNNFDQKRGLNPYKNPINHIYFPRAVHKREPGAILSWGIPAANKIRLINSSYRAPPGISRPAAAE